MCNKVIEAIRTREKAAAAGGDPSGGGTAPLDKEFSLPRITKVTRTACPCRACR